jgi:hypothetical protein
VAFALDPDEGLALAAGGIAVCTLLAAATLPALSAFERARRAEAALTGAEAHLHAAVEREARASGAALEQLLARSRADSLSLLAEEERKIGEQRRRELAEQESAAGDQLAERLAAVQRRVERRLAGWAEDIERAQANLGAQLEALAERQRQLVTEAESRINADVERLFADTEGQRAAAARTREDLGRAAEQIVIELRAELETHAAERRRALHELSERLRRRERELVERIEREESEAQQRIHASFADIDRRAVEELERATARATSRYSEQAALQFSDVVKRAREDAARRLARELDRAVETYAREASNVLAERLAQVGDAGAQRVEKRMTQIAAGLERQRDELAASLEQRLTDSVSELRRHLQAVVSEAEAERAILDARLHELARRIDEAAASARDRLGALDAPRTR